MNVLGCYQFRVTRNSDLFVDDEEVKNLRTALQGELPQRHFGDAVRLEVADNCSEVMAEFLLQQFGLDASRPLPRARHRESGAPDVGARPRRPARPQVPALPARPAQGAVATAARHLRRASARRTSCCTIPSSPSRRSSSCCEQAADDPQVVAIKHDRLSHRHRFGADGTPAARRPEGQGSDRGGRADGALRRGSQHQHRRAPGRSRRPCRVWRVRLQDPRQDADGGAPRRSTATAATSISAPATTTRAPRASIPTSACSPATRKSAPTSTRSSSSSPAWARPAH